MLLLLQYPLHHHIVKKYSLPYSSKKGSGWGLQDFSVKARCLLRQHVTLMLCMSFAFSCTGRFPNSEFPQKRELLLQDLQPSQMAFKLEEENLSKLETYWTGSQWKSQMFFLPVPWKEESINLNFFPVCKLCFSNSTGRNYSFKKVFKKLAEYWGLLLHYLIKHCNSM